MARADEGAAEYFGTGPDKSRRGRPRGKTQRSMELIDAAYAIAAETNPITMRGIEYRLFVAGVIASMARNETKRVSRLLTDAREEGWFPWAWIVDEHREMEKVSTWRDPASYVRAVRRSYRRDFWAQQPHRVQLWSEKSTVGGILRPVLEDYGVGFLPLHGYNSATKINEAAEDYDGRPLIVLYVGDWDCSGLHMSEVDLPGRLARYGGHHITVERIALLREDLAGLPSFPAASKAKDSRYRWFRDNYGDRCWELDAMNPNNLRDRVQERIEELIEPEAWDRCVSAEEAEQESLQALLDRWSAA